MKRGLEQWLEIGERRVFSILKKYTVCTEKQFQLKICEAGPYNQRIEPLILDKVGDKLYREEKILSKSISINNNNIGVFYLKEHDKQIVEKRIENLKNWYQIYYHFVQFQSGIYCGNVLEKMIVDAIKDTNEYIFFANIYEDTKDGIKVIQNGNLNVYNGKYTKNPLDCIAITKNKTIPIGIEIKNKIEWKYASDKDIWKMIKKCCELEILPLFISRKIPAITKFFFHKAGILGMETQFQFLHTSCKEKLEEVIKKDNLGYAHIKFETNYRQYMKKYFETVVLELSEVYYERFKINKEILYEYSDQLSKDINTRERTRLYKEVRDIIYSRYEDNGEEDNVDEEIIDIE
ncbi:TPA: hypothetical protein ACOTG0_003281 [Clostridium perfringens]